MSEEEGAEGGGGGGKKKIILIAAVVLLLIIIVAAAWFFLFRSSPKEEIGAAPGAGNNSSTGSGGINEAAEESPFFNNPIFSEPYEFTVNLRDGKRFLKLTMRIGLIDSDALTFLVERDPLVKDFIISTLQNKSSVDLRDAQGVAEAKRAIVRKLNTGVFTENFIEESETRDRQPVKKVLFTEFILQ